MCILLGLFLIAFATFQGSQGALGLAALEVTLALLFFGIAYKNYQQTGSISCQNEEDKKDTPNK